MNLHHHVLHNFSAMFLANVRIRNRSLPWFVFLLSSYESIWRTNFNQEMKLDTRRWWMKLYICAGVPFWRLFVDATIRSHWKHLLRCVWQSLSTRNVTKIRAFLFDAGRKLRKKYVTLYKRKRHKMNSTLQHFCRLLTALSIQFDENTTFWLLLFWLIFSTIRLLVIELFPKNSRSLFNIKVFQTFLL